MLTLERQLSDVYEMQVVEDAEAEYLAFFAEKTVAMIRAPDTYVYPAPFNLVEIFFVAPFESVYEFLPTRIPDESLPDHV